MKASRWTVIGILASLVLTSGCDIGGPIVDGVAEAVVRGTVKDSEGLPVAGVQIWVVAHEAECSDSGELAAPYDGNVRTDELGAFRERFLFVGGGGIRIYSVCTEIRAEPLVGSSLRADTILAGPVQFGRLGEDSLVVEIVLPDS